MHIACQCGQRFAISADRLPAKYRCNGCARLNWVAEDGRLQEMEEVQRESKRVSCRCGQSFQIDAATFPRVIRCHACGNRLTVLDNGELVEPGGIGETIAPTAIQTALLPQSKDSLSAAISAERLSLASTEGAAKLEAELKMIDLSWKFEMESYSLIPLAGIRIFPSKRGAVIVGIGIFAIWCFMIGLAFVFNQVDFIVPLGRFGIGPFILFGYIYRQAHALEKAEAAWQIKRSAAFAKWEAGPSKGCQ